MVCLGTWQPLPVPSLCSACQTFPVSAFRLPFPGGFTAPKSTMCRSCRGGSMAFWSAHRYVI